MINKVSTSLITQNFHRSFIIPGLVTLAALIALRALAALIHFVQKKPAAAFQPHKIKQPTLDSPPIDLHYKNNVQAIINFSSEAPIKSCRGKLTRAEMLSPLNEILPAIEGTFFSAFLEFETAKGSISQLSDALTQEIKLLEGLARIQQAYKKSSPYDLAQLDLLYTKRRACIEAHFKHYQSLLKSLPLEQQALVKPISPPSRDPITTVTLYCSSKSETEIQKGTRLLSEILSSVRARPMIRLHKPTSF